MRYSRRRMIGDALMAAGGAAAVGAAYAADEKILQPDRLPLGGGYASAADRRPTGPGRLGVTWRVATTQRLVALTFDDGPAPKFTPQVLDTLERHEAPATFFLVGKRLREHRALLDGRMARHEVGNHTWSHHDLGLLDFAGVQNELARTHEEIVRVIGRAPTLFRPPWGHLGGSTLLAAESFGYQLILWSHQAHERDFQAHPQRQVSDIVDKATPGTIVLGHDVGPSRRKVYLDRLDQVIKGIRERGFQLVTVSELLAAADPPPAL